MKLFKLLIILSSTLFIVSCGGGGGSSKSNNLQGCCSHHGGVAGCSGATVVCNDGWRGSSCSCSKSDSRVSYKDTQDSTVTPINLNDLYSLTGTYEIIYDRTYFTDDSVVDTDDCGYSRTVVSVDMLNNKSITKEQNECNGKTEYKYAINANLSLFDKFASCQKSVKEQESSYDLTIYNSLCSGSLDSRILTVRKIDDSFVELENKPWIN